MSEDIGTPVRVFCPHCQDAFETPSTVRSRRQRCESWATDSSEDDDDDEQIDASGRGDPGSVDGSYFGRTFPHVLLLSKPSLMRPQSQFTYEPRIYGFRVHNQRGRVPLTVGDSRGSYAVALPHTSSVTESSAIATAAEPPVGQKRRRAHVAGDDGADGDRHVDPEASSVIPRRALSSDASRTSLDNGADASSNSTAAQRSDVNTPKSSHFIATGPETGAPPTVGPFVFDVPGVPGGIPVYGVPLAGLRQSDSVCIGWRSSPLTSAYPPGPKPAEDDFYDTDDDTQVRVRGARDLWVSASLCTPPCSFNIVLTPRNIAGWAASVT